MADERVKKIFEAFENLSKEEQDDVIAHLFGAKSLPGIEPASREMTEEFKRIASEMFTKNHELFKKLAD